MKKLKLLLVDDDQVFLDELKEALDDNTNEITTSSSPSKALKLMESREFDIAILDIILPEMNGIQLLKKLKELRPNLEVIMITGQGDMDSVISAMRNGAADYFTKPFKHIELQSAIERTRKFKQLQNQLKKEESKNKLLSRELNQKLGTELTGTSKQTQHILELMNKVAAADETSVLITGESGTGKELVARGIHFLSPRKDNYFHSVNCSAIPESLFESEFFGYNKGAFTGASNNKSGWFEISNGGTLFLDEIGDLRIDLQAKFLRVLDEKIITRVGSHKQIDLDVRIIAATNQNLEELVKQNKFREDLYHRLNSFTIDIPPLRERREDIAALAEYFINVYSKKLKKGIKSIDPRVYEYLKTLPYYGNVRELKNMIERAVILCEDEVFTKKHFNCDSHSKNKVPFMEMEFNTLDLSELEKQVIEKALKHTQNNKTKAAALLNISRQALDRRLEKIKQE